MDNLNNQLFDLSVWTGLEQLKQLVNLNVFACSNLQSVGLGG